MTCERKTKKVARERRRLINLQCECYYPLRRKRLPSPAAGDIDTVRCTGWLPGITDEAYRGSVARYVWDLADRSASGWVVPLGASGDPRSAHHDDQLEAWAEARLLPLELDWSSLTPEGGMPHGSD